MVMASISLAVYMVVSGVDGCGLDHFSGNEFGRDDPAVRPFDRPDESAVAVPFDNHMGRVVSIPLGADQDQHSRKVDRVMSGVGIPFHHPSSASLCLDCIAPCNRLLLVALVAC